MMAIESVAGQRVKYTVESVAGVSSVTAYLNLARTQRRHYYCGLPAYQAHLAQAGAAPHPLENLLPSWCSPKARSSAHFVVVKIHRVASFLHTTGTGFASKLLVPM